MAADKEFLTYNQQMKKLRDKKKIDCGNTKDKTTLVRMGYFNLVNGYKEPFICGKDNNGNAAVFPDLQCSPYAIQPGHHDIHDQQMDILLVQDLNCLFPIIRFIYFIAILTQIDLDGIHDLSVIITYKNICHTSLISPLLPGSPSFSLFLFKHNIFKYFRVFS